MGVLPASSMNTSPTSTTFASFVLEYGSKGLAAIAGRSQEVCESHKTGRELVCWCTGVLGVLVY